MFAPFSLCHARQKGSSRAGAIAASGR
jgi:hypothetical protein